MPGHQKYINMIRVTHMIKREFFLKFPVGVWLYVSFKGVSSFVSAVCFL